MVEKSKFCPHCGKKQPTPFSEKEINKDPYEILQVSKNAEPEIIKAAYKRLAQMYHPDINASQSAQERIREINWAYGILSDPEKKLRWDKSSRPKDNKTAEAQRLRTRETGALTLARLPNLTYSSRSNLVALCAFR